MKNKLIITLVSVFTLLACQDDFLERYPSSQIAEGTFWKTPEHAEMGIKGLYSILRNPAIFGEIYKTDMLSPYMWFGYGLPQIENSDNAQFSDYSDKWYNTYKGIQRCNAAIAGIPNIDFKTENDLKNKYLAEAYFFRALFYWHLLDFYGGVPIYDKVIERDEAYKARNTPDEVRAFIESDLNKAIPYIPVINAGSDRGRVTKGACYMVKAKMYSANQEWLKAELALDTLMTLGYDLYSSYKDLFKVKGEYSKEDLLSIDCIMIEGYGSMYERHFGTRSTANSGWNQLTPTNYLVDEYEMNDGTAFNWDNYKVIKGEPFDRFNKEDWKKESLVLEIFKNRDPRLSISIITPWSKFTGIDNKVFTYKYPYKSSDATALRPDRVNHETYFYKKFVGEGMETSGNRTNSPFNIPIYRYADALLLYAECRNENTGPDTKVLAAINKVRARVGMPDVPSGLSKDELRKRIRRERIVELAAEGINYRDIIRWREGVEKCNHTIGMQFTMGSIAPRVFTERNYLWPIPQSEIDQNPLLIQNPGWEL